MSIEGQGHFLTLKQGRVHTKIQPDFLRNYFADLNQIFYESFHLQGNENLMTLCWPHEQDGRQAHL